LKTQIVRRLKTFSELKTQYNIDDIYRSGKRKYFSTIAKRAKLEGCPISRPTCRLSLDDYENTEKDESMLDPIWYSTDLKASKVYCRGKPDCTTYVYRPRDQSLVKHKRLVLLDLTGSLDNGTTYTMDVPFMKQIYDYIFQKYSEYIVDDNDGSEKYMCVDNPCKNTYTISEIASAYGYYGGRNSEIAIDRFFTLELFQIIKDLQIEETHNCTVLGYYHANLVTGSIEDPPSNSYFPAELTIKYGYSINKNCIEFKGEVASSSRTKSPDHNSNKRKSRTKSPNHNSNKRQKGGTKKRKHKRV
jgi:hypothetical protein